MPHNQVYTMPSYQPAASFQPTFYPNASSQTAVLNNQDSLLATRATERVPFPNQPLETADLGSSMQHQARMTTRANMQQSGSASRLNQSSAGLSAAAAQQNPFESSRPPAGAQPSQSAFRYDTARQDIPGHPSAPHPTGRAGEMALMARQRLYNREMLLKHQHAAEEMGRAAHFAETVRRHTAPMPPSQDPSAISSTQSITAQRELEGQAIDRAAMNERAYRQALISADRW